MYIKNSGYSGGVSGISGNVAVVIVVVAGNNSGVSEWFSKNNHLCR